MWWHKQRSSYRPKTIFTKATHRQQPKLSCQTTGVYFNPHGLPWGQWVCFSNAFSAISFWPIFNFLSWHCHPDGNRLICFFIFGFRNRNISWFHFVELDLHSYWKNRTRGFQSMPWASPFLFGSTLLCLLITKSSINQDFVRASLRQREMARIIKIFMAISRGIDDHLLSIALTLSYTQEGQVCLKAMPFG